MQGPNGERRLQLPKPSETRVPLGRHCCAHTMKYPRMGQVSAHCPASFKCTPPEKRSSKISSVVFAGTRQHPAPRRRAAGIMFLPSSAPTQHMLVVRVPLRAPGKASELN